MTIPHIERHIPFVKCPSDTGNQRNRSFSLVLDARADTSLRPAHPSDPMREHGGGLGERGLILGRSIALGTATSYTYSVNQSSLIVK